MLVVGQNVDTPAGRPDFTRRHAAGRLEQPDDCRAGQRFAGAGFADDAKTSPGAIENEMSSTATSVPRRVGKLDAQIAHLEQRRRPAMARSTTARPRSLSSHGRSGQSLG